jgi:hypothetical protein
MLKKIKGKEILILGDSRAGTVSQSIGIAEEIGFDYKIINLDYGFFSFLPNFLLKNSLLQLKKKCRKKIQKLSQFPHLIISAGRRSAPIALYLKKKSNSKSKVLQVMNPNLAFSEFDLVILPKHDDIDEKKISNVINIIGSPTKINDKKIAAEKNSEFSWLNDFKETKVALLFGGSSKKTKFTKYSAKKLGEISSRIVKNMGGMLFVLNSRRTTDNLENTLISSLKCPFKFFDWKKNKEKNPYLAILAYADFFIITGDSVSMISECCATGKPVYIFDEKKISAPKHRKFHKSLFNEKYAKKLEETCFMLENFPTKKLQETKRIAEIIKKKLLID